MILCYFLRTRSIDARDQSIDTWLELNQFTQVSGNIEKAQQH